MVLKLWHECNYLQANEGNLDFLHVSFLHYGQHDTFPTPLPRDPGRVSSRGAAPKAESIEVDLFDGGLRLCSCAGWMTTPTTFASAHSSCPAWSPRRAGRPTGTCRPTTAPIGSTPSSSTPSSHWTASACCAPAPK